MQSNDSLAPFEEVTALGYEQVLALFSETLDGQERPRPDIHSKMLRLADQALVSRVSQALAAAWRAGQRIWLTADLHLGHKNVLSYCARPFLSVGDMDEALSRQLGKVGPDDWLVMVGDVAMGDHIACFPLLRRVPGRKVLVVGNHDITRAGLCHYEDAANDDASPLFEAVVPFLYWSGHGGQQVVVSHYPLKPTNVHETAAGHQHEPERPLLNYHGHLHRDLLPHRPSVQYINVGWDATQGLVCI